MARLQRHTTARDSGPFLSAPHALLKVSIDGAVDPKNSADVVAVKDGYDRRSRKMLALQVQSAEFGSRTHAF